MENLADTSCYEMQTLSGCFLFVEAGPTNEPRHDKTCFCHMQTTKALIRPDQRLCCSLSGYYNTSTCYSRNFKTLASL